MDIIPILLVFAAIAFIVISTVLNSRKAKRKLRERIIQAWGKVPEGKYDPGDIESIASYFLNHKKAYPDRFFIDDITWQDLDMDDLFIRLNGTETSAGEEVLYRLLKEPCFDPEVLKQRREWIEVLRNNGEERLKLQLILAKMGKQRHVDIADYFFKPVPLRQWKTKVYKLLAGIALVSPLALFLHTGVGTLLIILSLSTNIFVYCKRKSEIETDLAAFKIIVGLVYCVSRIIDTDPAVLRSGDLRHRLQLNYDRIRDIGKRGFFIFYTRTYSLWIYPMNS